MKYKVEISGAKIESQEMQEVIAERLAKKKIALDDKTLEQVTEATMHHIYKLNMENRKPETEDEEIEADQFHYVVLDTLIYRMDAHQHRSLLHVMSEWVKAQETQTEDNDGADEWNDMNNYVDWVKENLKPLSTVNDNLDMHRYDRVCEKCESEKPKTNDDDLPF